MISLIGELHETVHGPSLNHELITNSLLYKNDRGKKSCCKYKEGFR